MASRAPASAASSTDGATYKSRKSLLQLADASASATFSTSGKMPSVKLSVFTGDRTPGVYKEWRKEIEAVQLIYGIDDKTIAPLVYLSLEAGAGKPRELAEQLDLVSDIATDDGLKKIYALLDAEYKDQPHKEADTALPSPKRSLPGPCHFLTRPSPGSGSSRDSRAGTHRL